MLQCLHDIVTPTAVQAKYHVLIKLFTLVIIGTGTDNTSALVMFCIILINDKMLFI